MQGLTNIERNGCKTMLGLLSKGDILSLTDTVTNKMIAAESVTEAVEAILSYSNCAEELLKRKKVHRDVIFKYLAKEGVVIPSNSEKHQLIKKTLEFWSNATVKTEKVVFSQSPDTEAEQRVSVTADVAGEAVFEPLALARQFCQWFYQLLNSQNPSLGQPPQDWGPQHFWEDVRLCLLTSINGQQTEEFHGSELASLRLLALTRDEKLLLSPNLEPHGLRALSSPHGLVLVAVAGTIHRDRACLGIYEQVFGLIRSPLDKNQWKIKFVKLKIRGQDSLSGAEELLSPALTCDSSELQLLCS
ncbi:uncharacterized protein C3orf38 homolog isoform X1 [Hypomesus transpacificus]|uniref:uncharacterized protein C3orf38 homolog isoform X1 n=1 Tax=Hypomesus transpacificus TaxID=137520 RepID=UPI001F084325|nr:uncharacterized protein C3orf38 homolog isoform X1 [Hypomesus transpacificus]